MLPHGKTGGVGSPPARRSAAGAPRGAAEAEVEGARSRSRRRPRGGDGHLGGLSGAVPPAHAPRNRRAPLGDAGARRGAQREQRQRCARWALGYVGVDVARESKGPLCAVPRHSSRRRLIGGATAFCKHRRCVGAAVRFEARAGRRPRGRGTRLPWQTAGKRVSSPRGVRSAAYGAQSLCARGHGTLRAPPSCWRRLRL